MEIAELRQKIEFLTKENIELKTFKQDYYSAKQSLNRMSTRLRKLCKRLSPSNEIVLEMQQIANEIRDISKKVTD